MFDRATQHIKYLEVRGVRVLDAGDLEVDDEYPEAFAVYARGNSPCMTAVVFPSIADAIGFAANKALTDGKLVLDLANPVREWEERARAAGATITESPEGFRYSAAHHDRVWKTPHAAWRDACEHLGLTPHARWANEAPWVVGVALRKPSLAAGDLFYELEVAVFRRNEESRDAPLLWRQRCYGCPATANSDERMAFVEHAARILGDLSRDDSCLTAVPKALRALAEGDWDKARAISISPRVSGSVCQP